MPVQTTYPGLYVEEISSGVHPISGVSTSDTAFVDAFAQGPVDEATRVTSFDDFLRKFGPLLDSGSPAGHGVMQYFINGGQVAWIVRVVGAGGGPAFVNLTGGSAPSDTLVVTAKNPGMWGNSVQVAVATDSPDPAVPFTLVVRRLGQVGGRRSVIASEVHRNLTMTIGDPRNAERVIEAASALITVAEAAGGLGQKPTPLLRPGDVTSPSVIGDVKKTADELGFFELASGADGGTPTAADLIAGLAPLRRIEPAVINLLCIPAAADLDAPSIASTPLLQSVAGAVADFCDDFRCFYLLDIPQGVDSPEKAVTWLDANTLRDRNAAVHFPRLKIVDPQPLRQGALLDVASSGTMAGIFARTDSESGIWKAPAGIATQLRSVAAPAGKKLNDSDSALLNPFGINAIRNLPVYGTVSWGARTLYGSDPQASEWKYIPIRRTALYIEESLVQGLRWVVFEPNDEPLWSQIRLNVGAFMQTMFRRGAFQGATPREAYLVKCDSSTTTQADIDTGVVNILVGFAPLKPAEFVVIQLQQLTRPSDL